MLSGVFNSRLEIMEQMAVLQETAYEQLYRWAQSEFDTHTHTQARTAEVRSQWKIKIAKLLLPGMWKNRKDS